MAHRSMTDRDNTVVDIRSSRRFRQAEQSRPAPADIDEFANQDQPDDFRHRMVTNAAAFAFVAVLVLSGLWLADSLALMRKNQDCVLSGKRGCTPVETQVSR
jgi:hypothetical protein